mmetsp:Transcript_83244/g.193361  ORF Transcript_83244/g.193361 Transcript_83244/m.193361 type:complete len:204 (+) Transcript_83244:582-1193(+)
MRMQSFTPSKLGSPSAGCGGTLFRSISRAGMASSESHRCGTWAMRSGENLVLKWLSRGDRLTLWSRSDCFHRESSKGRTKITSLEGSITPSLASSVLYACLMVGMTPSPKHQRSRTSEMITSNFSSISSPTCKRVDIIGGSSCTNPFLSVTKLALTATTSRHICRICGTASQSQTSAPSRAAAIPRTPMPQPASRTRGRRPRR